MHIEAQRLDENRFQGRIQVKVSASKTGLLERCLYWAKDGVEWNDVAGYPARRSSALHRAIASHIAGAPPEPSWTEWFRHRFSFAAKWLKTLPADTIKAPELGFAYSPETGEVSCLGMVDRKYPEGAFCGTVDLIQWSNERRTLDILDWKAVRFLTHDAVWPQLESLAMMAHKWLTKHVSPVHQVNVIAAHIHEGGVVPHIRRLDANQLQEAEERLRLHLTMIPTATPEPGPWCDSHYCPARMACPRYEGKRAA